MFLFVLLFGENPRHAHLPQAQREQRRRVSIRLFRRFFHQLRRRLRIEDGANTQLVDATMTRLCTLELAMLAAW